MGDSFMNKMVLLRRRSQKCREWMNGIDREVKNGDITFHEYMEQMQMIREEIATTD